MKKFRVTIFWILVLAVVAAAAVSVRAWREMHGPAEGRRVTLEVDGLTEASGLAASHRAPNLFFSLNDSGNEPVLYAFDAKGNERGRIRVRGVKNHDWEALAGVEIDGRAYLFVGDIGDNLSRRRDTMIHVIEEPDPAVLTPKKEITADIVWSLPVRFTDGPRDCETMLVDARRREVLLISKRTMPPTIYRLPLQGKPGEIPWASPVGRLVGLPQPSSFQRLFPSARGRYRGQPTDGAISSDDAHAAILTYGCVAIYHRAPNESWAAALGRKPDTVLPHDIPVSEALSFSPDGAEIFITGEGAHATLLEHETPRS